MNWTKLSAIAEVVSSGAILVTLIYLALQNQHIAAQTQQNTQALQASTRESVLANAANILSFPINDPETWLLSVKPELSSGERVRLSAYLFLSIGEHARISWRQYQEGALDEAGWLAVEGPAVSEISTVQGRKWWTYFSAEFEESFRDQMNSKIDGVPVRTQLPDVLAFD